MYDINEATRATLDRNFTHHSPIDDQVARYQRLRSDARTLAYTFVALCPPSRELALALTHLEDSVMWANASIARNENNQGEPNALPQWTRGEERRQDCLT